MGFHGACISTRFSLEVTMGYVIFIFHMLKGTSGLCILIALQNGISMKELRRRRVRSAKGP